MPGWWVQREVQDLEAFLNALRDSGKVNSNKIGMVGGSAGATLVALVASDTTDTGSSWPYWGASKRPACAVMLSGAYDFSDTRGPDGQVVMNSQTIKDIENFCQTGDPATQKSLSPVTKLSALSGSFVPMFLISSEFDPMIPHQQLDDMLCAIESKGIDTSSYKYLVLWNSNLHSFSYWQSCDGLPYRGSCTEVRDDIIAFLDSYLK
jgi:dipeptidyl aminopeptidase/acylaminoacyl peptidase